MLHLEKVVNDAWTLAWSAVIPLCLSDPIVVSPDATYRDSLYLFGGYPGTNVFPKFAVGEIPGVYRIVWRDILSSYNDRARPFGEQLALTYRISNRFVLALPH
jgi:hypothetical protein